MKIAQSKKLNKTGILDSPQWHSESSFSNFGNVSNSSGSPSGSGSGSGGPAPCEIGIAVFPHEGVCCPESDKCPTAIYGQAWGNANCKLTVTLPDGTVKTGKGFVSFGYKVRKADCGSFISFGVTGKCGKTAAAPKSVSVPVFKIDFRDIVWEPEVSNDWTYTLLEVDPDYMPNLFPAGTKNLVYFPDIDDQDLVQVFQSYGEAKIFAVPDVEGSQDQMAVRDTCCSRWRLEVVQAIVPPFECYLKHTRRKTAQKVVPIPGRDGKSAEDQSDPYPQHGAIRSVNCADTPNYGDRIDVYITTRPIDPNNRASPKFWFGDNLKEIRKFVNFHTWLVARNETCNTYKALAWCHWRIDWTLGVTVAGNPPVVTFNWINKTTELVAQGMGEGPRKVIFEPRIKKQNTDVKL